MMSCADAGESQPTPPCAWRDTLGPRPNSGSVSSSNMTSAPPDKPGYDKSKKWSNRDPQPLRRRGSRLWDPTGRLATDMEFCARGVVAHIPPKTTSGARGASDQFPSGASSRTYSPTDWLE